MIHVFRGSDAAASLKPVEMYGESPEQHRLPRQRCRGLIEAVADRCPIRGDAQVFRGSDAAASLKRP